MSSADTGSIFWPGSGSAPADVSGSTPFGLYDDDTQFQLKLPKVQNWVGRRLGYPVQDVELTNLQIAACFEEAISEYASQVNAFNIRNNISTLRGAPTGSNISGTDIVGSSVPYIVRLSDEYGTEAGSGGNISWKTGSIDITSGSQVYNLDTLYTAVSESGNTIEIKRIFNEGTPALNRFFDPLSSGGSSYRNMINEFGFGSYSPASTFVLMPLYEDMLRAQAIEISDSVRKSAYSFELINNELRIFPRPNSNFKLHFHYIVENDRWSQATDNSRQGVVSDYSNVPYQAMTYSQINEVGRQWIQNYTLALSKELLGINRGKFGSIPIPGNEISLDGSELRSEAATDKERLIMQLRETLEEVSDKNQMQMLADKSEQHQSMLNKIPLSIYLGSLLVFMEVLLW